MPKIKLAVLFGGASSEYDISIMSARSIIDNLSEDKYELYKIGITKDGRWRLYNGESKDLAEWEKNSTPAFLSPDTAVHGIISLKDGGYELIPIDCVFPVLHGKNGEDGTMQGLLEMSGIPYVGCNTLASAICMDKAVCHSLLANANVEQAHYLWFYADRYDAAAETIRKKIVARLNFPVFVKPANSGSSIGITKVDGPQGLDSAVETAAKEDSKIIVEEGIKGQEVEVAVLGNRDCEASLVGEIGATASFYDFDDKYINGTSRTIIPAGIEERASEEIRSTAVRVYRLLGLSGLARVDFFVRESDGKVILNEINTMPGFTDISMYPKLWMAEGFSYPGLLDRLIELAFEKKAAGRADG